MYTVYDTIIMSQDAFGTYIHTIKFLFNNADSMELFITKNDP